MEIFSLGPDEDRRTCWKLVSLNILSPVNEETQDYTWKNRMRNLHSQMFFIALFLGWVLVFATSLVFFISLAIGISSLQLEYMLSLSLSISLSLSLVSTLHCSILLTIVCVEVPLLLSESKFLFGTYLLLSSLRSRMVSTCYSISDTSMS